MNDEINKPIETVEGVEISNESEPITVIEPIIETPPVPLSGEANSEPTIIPDPTPEPITSAESISDTIIEASVSEPNPEQTPVGRETEGPELPSEGQTPNTTNQTAFSSNPKLNAAALSFISYMGRTKETLALANKARKAQMMKRVYRVMDLFKKSMPPHTFVNKWVVGVKKITNRDVRDFIHTDDSTATKYLNILTKENKIRKVGKNHAPYYIKNE